MAYSYTQIKTMADAVRNICLAEVLRLNGAVRDKYDKQKWHTSKGMISVTSQKFMNFSLDHGGGGAIDLVIHLRSFDFRTAVIWLYDRWVCNPPPPQKDCFSFEYHFIPPRPDKRHLPKVTGYLKKDRKIPLFVIDQLVRAQRIYADANANAVFLLLGKEKRAVGAELRGTTRKRWVGLSPGSKKNQGAFFIRARTPRSIIICESAIDAISCYTLHPDCIAVSTAGANATPGWLPGMLARWSIDVFCGFDSDDVGERKAEKMIRQFPQIKRLRPQPKDWNEVLKSKSPLK